MLAMEVLDTKKEKKDLMILEPSGLGSSLQNYDREFDSPQDLHICRGGGYWWATLVCRTSL